MTDRSRRSFLRSAAVGGALTGGAVLLPSGLARAAATAAGVRQDRAARAAPQFELTVVNNSSAFEDVCVYQSPVDLGVQDALALAWLTAPAHPLTTVTFTWTETYNFVWSDTADLSPGVTFNASEVVPADPNNPTQQQILLGYEEGAYTFLNGQAVGQPQLGNLYIQELDTVPLNGASVGIGMSGAGTFVTAAEPNINLVFTPRPQYWVAAGTFEAGQVLSLQELTGSSHVAFPPGVFAMTAVLNQDNTWTITPTGA